MKQNLLHQTPPTLTVTRIQTRIQTLTSLIQLQNQAQVPQTQRTRAAALLLEGTLLGVTDHLHRVVARRRRAIGTTTTGEIEMPADTSRVTLRRDAAIIVRTDAILAVVHGHHLGLPHPHRARVTPDPLPGLLLLDVREVTVEEIVDLILILAVGTITGAKKGLENETTIVTVDETSDRPLATDITVAILVAKVVIVVLNSCCFDSTVNVCSSYLYDHTSLRAFLLLRQSHDQELI